MPDSEKPEFAALDELESVVRHLSDELAMWRRRAQKAEVGDRTGGGGAGGDAGSADLKLRLDVARSRLQDLLKRLRFLEEQSSVHEVR